MNYPVDKKQKKVKEYLNGAWRMSAKSVHDEQLVELCKMCGLEEYVKDIEKQYFTYGREMSKLMFQIQKTIETVSNPKFRITLLAHYVEGYTYSEIAKRIGVSKSTIANWINRGVYEITMPKNPIIV